MSKRKKAKSKKINSTVEKGAFRKDIDGGYYTDTEYESIKKNRKIKRIKRLTFGLPFLIIVLCIGIVVLPVYLVIDLVALIFDEPIGFTGEYLFQPFFELCWPRK